MLRLNSEILDHPKFDEDVDFSVRNEEEFKLYAYSWFAQSDHEGVVKNMYLDHRGNVTIGIGHLIASSNHAKLLMLTFRVSPIPPRDITDTDKVADYDSVIALWSTIKEKPENERPTGRNKKFLNATKLDLDEREIQDLFDKDIAVRLKRLKVVFKDFDKYPDAAKLGILEMYYTLGEKFFNEYPKLISFVKQQDWSSAGAQSVRRGIPPKRAKDTVDLFDEAEAIKKGKQSPPDPVKNILAKPGIKEILDIPREFPDMSYFA